MTETKYDDLTVRELSEKFDRKFVEDELDKKVSEYFSKFRGGFFAGASPSQLVQYWKSYDDHIKRYNDKITSCRAGIMYDLETLDKLIKARDEVAAQKKMFDKIDIEWWPMKDNPEYSRKCYDVVKEHEIKHHLDYLLDEYDPNVDRVQKKHPAPYYELLCDDNGKFKYIRCKNCYKKKLLSQQEFFGYEYEDMDIDKQPGGGK